MCDDNTDPNKRYPIDDLDVRDAIIAEKELELLRLHNILFAKHICKVSRDLNFRTRLYRVYLLILTRRNIVTYYNLPMDEFYDKLLAGEIEV